MLFYLVRRGEKVNRDTKLKAYDVEMQEFGSGRETLSVGKIVEIDGKLVEIWDYVYSEQHKKGYHVYVDYNPRIYKGVRVENKDVGGNAEWFN